ncbi:MAG: hypothetical protein B7Z82_05905 [Halothiobacillus sp. 20-54-6]|nr:MAG: hypothetical protein B7Z82_05905 [Halothiobacillus sp. 20-54-6]
MTALSLPESPLPPIPNKRYFTIGEVGGLCNVKSHVLRYWEQEFTQLKPTKRRGNRRYYQRHDIELIRLIRTLLYDQGFTIAGARQQLVQAHKNSLKVDSIVGNAGVLEPTLDWHMTSSVVDVVENIPEPTLLARKSVPGSIPEIAPLGGRAEVSTPVELKHNPSESLVFLPGTQPLVQVRQALELILKDLESHL